MYLIDNQPTIDFSSYVDLGSLLKLKPYLDYAVVKSSSIVTPTRYYHNQFLDQKYQGINDVYNIPVDFEFYQELKDTDQLASWLRYNQDLIHGQQSVQIRCAINWNTKHINSEVFDTKNIQYWQCFFDWIDEQNIFNEYGRVVVFLNEPGVETPIHRDSPDPTRRDEFIWVSLGNRKKMFVYDAEKNIKYYVDTPIGLFDATNYHGAEAGELASWSLRVDGIFSKEFLDKTGLYHHFRL